ncbi:MAG: NUDIX hydrolase [Desulfobacterium sp.]|nr:NUDIX hydrolase [Desulfobacterium sp.]
MDSPLISGAMKPRGCSIVFLNRRNQILLLLRDEKPGLPCAGMWDLPGGHVEADETPEQCIVREMDEEMGLTLCPPALFQVVAFDDRTEYVFWQPSDLDIHAIVLTEGQCLKWFDRDEACGTVLAFGFNQLVEAFFAAMA